MKLLNTLRSACICCILVLNFNSTQAQSMPYAPFPDSAVVWREDLLGLAFNCCCSGMACLYEDHYQYYTNGDTVANSYTYSKIYKTGFDVSYIGGPFTCPPTCTNYVPVFYSAQYQGGIREDIAAKKVYFLDPSTGNDTLLYDFNLSLGASLPFSYINYMPDNVVTLIDSVLVGNQFHNRYWISSQSTPNYVALIEGIGSTFGLLYPLVPPFEFFNTLACVTVNSQTVYPDTTTACPLISGIEEPAEEIPFKIYPNPVSEIATIHFPSAPDGTVSEVFDYKGQLIASLLFKNGSTTWNTERVSNGFYVVRVQTSNGRSYEKKIIVQ